jgi:NADPH:quinone reductase-like Zn-dependent oxidoreductase
MRALVFKRYGRPDQVTFADTPRPVPRPDEILVQVHAAGLNPIDNMIPKGTFKPILRFQLPATLGSDLAGVVVEVGSRVTRFKPGDAGQYLRPGHGRSRRVCARARERRRAQPGKSRLRASGLDPERGHRFSNA